MQPIEFLLFLFFLFLNILSLDHFKEPVKPLKLLPILLPLLHSNNPRSIIVNKIQVLHQIMFHLIRPEIHPATGQLTNILFHHISNILIQLLGTLNLLNNTLPHLITHLQPKLRYLPIPRISFSLFHDIMAVDKQRAHI